MPLSRTAWPSRSAGIDRPSSLLLRLIQPEEVANLVAYLASPLAAATNGAAVKVEGGLIRSIL